MTASRDLQRLRAALDDIARVWHTTATMPAVTERVTRPAPGPRIPGNPHALSEREATQRHIARLAHTLIGAHHRPPLMHEADVPAIATWLATQAEDVLRYDPDAATTTDTHARALLDIAERVTRRRIHVGPCPVTSCPGHITSVVRSDADVAPPRVSCDGPDRHTWPPAAWRTLARAIRAHAHRAHARRAAFAHRLHGTDTPRKAG